METFNIDNIRYGAPIIGTVPDSKPVVTTIRVPITYRYPDGSYGPLLISTEEDLFSFGLQENVSQETGKLTGYSISLCMHNRDGPTQKELAWVDTFNQIIEHSKDHLVSNRDAIQRYELERSDLKKLNPLYYKKEKGVIIPGRGPMLYPKCIRSAKDDKILTIFYDGRSGLDIDPTELIGKFNHSTAVIKFESIFVGAQISYQVKVHECAVKLAQQGMARVLPRRETTVHIEESHTTPSIPPTSSTPSLSSILPPDESQVKLPSSVDDEGSLNGDSSEDEVDEAPKILNKKPPVRMVTKVQKKK
jgi:hypothetical protein